MRKEGHKPGEGDNGDYLPYKGNGTVAIESYSGTKLILDIVYVLELDQNLLTVGKILGMV